jgi:23S rRNA (adenine1618-N6)-methyltransferase
LLNKALLNHYYGIKNWDFPAENLCPPIPGRADYLHYMADLLIGSNFGTMPTGEKITALDIGVGANCIYPIIGVTEYNWNFIGSDIDKKSVESAKNIVASNESLKDKIEVRLQENPDAFFEGIISDNDFIDLTFCNPPFHSSSEEAQKGTARKVKNLSGKKTETPTLNFAGVSNELIYVGGEALFIQKMIEESKKFGKKVFWFSTLVSKESNLKRIYKQLKDLEVVTMKTIPMGTGNKSSRVVAWSFLTKKEQQNWRETKWRK